MKKTSPINPATLTREEKLKLIAALEEREKRRLREKDVYAPHAGQMEVHLCPEDERYVFAGNGSGKTTLGSNETKWAVEGHNPIRKIRTLLPCRGFIILDKPDKVEQVILPELRKWMEIRPEWCHKRGKPYVSSIEFPSGSFIKFLFWDQEPMTAEGIEGDWFWFDEPPPRALYVALKRAGRTKGRRARYLITGTPLAAPWLRTEVYEPWAKGERPNTACFRFGTEKNRANLAEDYIEKFSAVLSEKERRIRLEGEFFDLDGLALAHLFRRDTHTIERSDLQWNEENPCVVITDPHPHKKHHSVLLGADADGQLVVLDEFSAKLVAREYAQALVDKGWFHSHRVIDILYDSLGSTDGTGGEGFKSFGQVMNEVLAENGIGRARATSYAEKDDEEWISRIQDCLLVPKKPDNFGRCRPKLLVCKHCTGTISDIENVQWARDKRLDQSKPKLDISNKDFLSCVKYGLATNLYFKKAKDKAYYVSRPRYGFNLLPGRRAR